MRGLEAWSSGIALTESCEHIRGGRKSAAFNEEGQVKTPPSDLILIPCFVAFGIAALSWFFSSRRGFFLRILMGHRPLQGPPAIPDQPEFQRGLRVIALLQFTLAMLITLFVYRHDLLPGRNDGKGPKMSTSLASWPRPNYEQPGGRPFLFYIVYGEFPSIPQVEGQKYRTLGIPPGLTLNHYSRKDHPDVFSGFEEGYLWEALLAQNPALARRVAGATQCLILRGELDDQSNLNYFRDSVGLLTVLLDHGGVCVYDPQMFRWWEPEAWRRHVFEPAGAVPRHHVMILTSKEDESPVRNEPLTWFHTRGMRKFGRPDLSVHDVPSHHHTAVIDLFHRFIELQAFGGVIPEGKEIRISGLPPGMTCHHAGELEDPDFNNVHVEITPPR
jgi:hypothetical protein